MLEENRRIKMVKTLLCTLKRRKIEAQNLKFLFFLKQKSPKLKFPPQRQPLNCKQPVPFTQVGAGSITKDLPTNIICPKKAMNTLNPCLPLL